MNKLQRRVIKLQEIWDEDASVQAPMELEASEVQPKTMGIDPERLTGLALEYVMTALLPEEAGLSFCLHNVACLRSNLHNARDLASVAMAHGFLMLAHDEEFFYVSNAEGTEVLVLPHEAVNPSRVDREQVERSYTGIDRWLDGMIRRETTKEKKDTAYTQSLVQGAPAKMDAWERYVEIMRAHPDPNYTGLMGRPLLVEFILHHQKWIQFSDHGVRYDHVQDIGDELARGADPNYVYLLTPALLLAANVIDAVPFFFEAGVDVCTKGFSVHPNKEYHLNKLPPQWFQHFCEIATCECKYCLTCSTSHPPGPCPLEENYQYFLDYKEMAMKAVEESKAFKSAHRGFSICDEDMDVKKAMRDLSYVWKKQLTYQTNRPIYDNVK